MLEACARSRVRTAGPCRQAVRVLMVGPCQVPGRADPARGRPVADGRTPPAGPPAFDEGALLRLAGWGAFERAGPYVARVSGRTVSGSAAHATVGGTAPYLVDLSWGAGVLRGQCTCPAAAGGAFCKHQVALGLSMLREESEPRPPPPPQQSTRRQPVERDPAAWLDRVREALRRGTFLDYRRAIDFGRDAERLLDELEDALDAGAADAVRPALERATTRLRTVLLRADDSEGEIARACFRATELFARSCREGNPDGPKLARWLLKFRLPVQGWSTARLADFAPAFDEKAWRIYRQGVAAAARPADGTRPRATKPRSAGCSSNCSTTTAISTGPSDCSPTASGRSTARSSPGCRARAGTRRSWTGSTERCGTAGSGTGTTTCTCRSARRPSSIRRRAGPPTPSPCGGAASPSRPARARCRRCSRPQARSAPSTASANGPSAWRPSRPPDDTATAQC